MEQNLSKSTQNELSSASYRVGSFLFLFVELLLFGSLLTAYFLYFAFNNDAFSLAASELSSTYGVSNTVIILLVAYTMYKSLKGIDGGSKKHALGYLIVALIFAFIFITNKLFIWNGKIAEGLYPGSLELWQYGVGDSLFYFFYYLLDALHIIHVVVGLVLVSYAIFKVENNSITIGSSQVLNVISNYWYIVTGIWCLIYGAFYIIA